MKTTNSTFFKSARILLLSALVLGLTACNQQAEAPAESDQKATQQENSEQKDLTQEDESSLAETTERPDGIVPIEEWAELYPNQVESFKQNAEESKTTYGGSVPISYLEENPYLNKMYEGFGFAKQYDRARGHVYALEDALHTARPKKGASCLACKTSVYADARKDEGIEVASEDFEQFAQNNTMQGFTCYDCHGNEPGVINPNRVHLTNALEQTPELNDQIPGGSMSCAQCHVEYYQDAETVDIVLPWTNGFGAEEAYAYYQEHDFADWEHPTVGSKLLKAQHPEIEMFEGSVHAQAGLDCMACHMPMVEAEDGTKYRSHHWTSPLKNAEASCLTCHQDMSEEQIIAAAEAWQKPVVELTDEVGFQIEEMILCMEECINDGSLQGEDLAKVQELHREAQFYFDYVFVENSEGFHNNEKMTEYLNHAKELVEEANTMLKIGE